MAVSWGNPITKHSPMLRTFVLAGSLNAFLAVALGAFGAHALKARISAEMLTVYQTGVHYHLIHALSLLSVALLAEKFAAASLLWWTGRLFTMGIILFSGSLYALSLSGIRAFGAITPLGGVCFLTGWALLALAALRHRPGAHHEQE